jgi:ABC-2 type transport system permease protein
MSPALQDERSAPRHGIRRDRAAARSLLSATWGSLPDALHAEWTKLRTVSSTAWLLLAAIVVTIATGAITSSIVQCQGSCQADPAKISLTGVVLGQATIAVLAVLAMTSEYSTGMIRATLTAVPRRSTVLAAKAAVLTAVVLVAGTIAVLGSVLAGELLLPGNGFTAAHGFGPLTLVHGPVLRAAAGSVLYFWLIAMLGLGVAAAVRESGVATTLVLGLLYVLPINGSLILNPRWERRFQRYSPMDAGLAIQATRNLSKLPIGPWEGLGVLACWAAVAMLAGWGMLRWRDA